MNQRKWAVMVTQQIERTDEIAVIDDRQVILAPSLVKQTRLDQSESSGAGGNYWSLFGFLTEGWRRTAIERQSTSQDVKPIEPRQLHQRTSGSFS